MIIEQSDLKGLKSDLEHLDEVTTKLGFVRWQWEYYRATYDLKIIDTKQNADYFLRVNARVVLGKLEAKDAVLVIEDSFIGKATFPHGLDYESTVPAHILKTANHALLNLKQQLSE
jgi:hypothetical protein